MAQKNCTKMVGAHSRSHFSEDKHDTCKRVFMVLKYTDTGNVLETTRRFQRQFPNQRTPCRQTIMDNYNKHVQYGLCLNRHVGKSGSSCLGTAFETFWLFPNITGLYIHLYFKNHKHPFIYWKLWSGMCTSHLHTVLLLFVPFVCSRSWFHLP